jgi:exosortase
MNPPELIKRYPSARWHILFLFFLAFACALLLPPVTRLGISFSSDYYSHIPLIPLVSVYLLAIRRRTVFVDAQPALLWGGSVMTAGGVLYGAGLFSTGLQRLDASSLMVFAGLLFLSGSFMLLYGTRALSRSAFPFLFLLFMVPIPSAVMERIISFLQAGSAGVTHMIFAMSGIPHLREGLTFHLPTFSIEIAKECSGIRSSLALAITTVLAAHMFLQTGWQKIVLAASILPLVLIKNGIRISVLTFLGMYVDQRILVDGFLHKSGGIFFFIPVLLLTGLLLYVLRRVGGACLRPTSRAPSTLAPKRSADA